MASQKIHAALATFNYKAANDTRQIQKIQASRKEVQALVAGLLRTRSKDFSSFFNRANLFQMLDFVSW